MSKATTKKAVVKKKAPKKRAAKYEEKLQVDMNFSQLLKATLPKNKRDK